MTQYSLTDPAQELKASYVLIPILFRLGIFYSIKSLNTFLLVCPPQSEDSNTMP